MTDVKSTLNETKNTLSRQRETFCTCSSIVRKTLRMRELKYREICIYVIRSFIVILVMLHSTVNRIKKGYLKSLTRGIIYRELVPLVMF